ncbi:MAG: TonB-dependent receptor plug domain-containing protein, partial [Marinicaulis sp.]|nr:TonB-dependent receptor plug domain-containing protein [Marinicaulis sp.]
MQVLRWIFAWRNLLRTIAAAATLLSTVYSQDDVTAAEEIHDVIFVTGTRIPRPDAQAASPVASFDREAINTFRSMTIEDFINDLPLVTPDFGRTGNNPGDGTARINLRGLGPQRSLILLNGRRVAPAGIDSAVDINTIPSALLERVEIVSGGASAVYGSDAVTGAVNFITRDNLQGVEISGQFDIFGVGDGETYNTSIIAGTDFADGRGHVTVYGDYLNGTPVRSDAREFTSVVIGENRTTGELIERGSFTVPEGVIGFPPAMLNGELVFPIFNEDGSFREWFFNEETYNFAPDNYLQTAIERWSGGAFIDFEIYPDFELFSEFMFSRPTTKSQLAPTPANLFASFTIDSAFFADSTREELRAAYDPDGDGIGDAFVAKRLEEVGPRQSHLTGNYYRSVVGFRTDLTAAWTVDGYYSYSRNDNLAGEGNNVSRSRLLQGLLVDPSTNQCVDPSGGCVPVNIFGLGNISAEAVDFIRVDGIENKSHATQH